MLMNQKRRLMIIAIAFVVFLGLLGIKMALKSTSVKAETGNETMSMVRTRAGVTKAQVGKPALPPLPGPYINTIVEGKRQIIVRNPRREPVRVIAEIEVSDNAYGNGFLTITHISNKGIAALKGEFWLTTDSGDVIKDGWSFSYGGKIHAPGEEWKVPVGGPINPIVASPRKIVNRLVAMKEKS